MIPFVTKDVLMIRVVRDQSQLVGFSVLQSIVPEYDSFIKTGGVGIVLINWKKQITKIIAPVHESAVEVVVRSWIEAFGKDLIQAQGIPTKEVLFQIKTD